MKQNDMFLLFATAAALYMITKTVKAKAGTISAAGQQYTSIVANDNGWQYFSDGTAIGPDGSYYYQGQKVWTPVGAAGAASTVNGNVYPDQGMTAAGAAGGW